MADPSHAWLKTIIDSPALAALAKQVGTQPGRSTRSVVQGIQGSSTAVLAGALSMQLRRPVLLIVPHLDDADDMLDDLELFNDAGLPVLCRRFGALEVLPGETNVSLELLAERLAAVEAISQGDWPRAFDGEARGQVLIAPIQALMQSVPEPDVLGQMSLTLKPGLDMPPGKLLDWLVEAGYQRVDAIEQPGDFAVRGGIIDIYPPAGTSTDNTGGGATKSDDGGAGLIRLDYFGDDIDSIRRIDPDTMGSSDLLKRVQIIGATTKQLQSDEHTTSLLSLLPPGIVVVMHELMELAEQARGYYERLTNPRGIYSPQAVFKAVHSLSHVEVNQYSGSADAATLSLPVEALMAFDHDASKAIDEVAALATEGGERDVTVVLCPKRAEADRLREIVTDQVPHAKQALLIEVGYLHRGFVWRDDDTGVTLHLVPHQELFHRYHTRRRVRRLTAGASARAADAFLDLEVGDYVVHVDHGISQFVGLRTMRKDETSEEYLTLEFAGRARLHVPVTQIDLVQKYVGGFEGKPPLSTLGGKRWQKQKEQTAEAVKDLAAEMLRIQAARASLPGIRYPDDTTWMKEFEAEFPYTETDDQLAAIASVKRDMTTSRPMDRLICGDVGFGKTEVAIRAAFKAAEFGKQVAVLVPTTVLAEQHERTFRSRMADYPFRVESLSRFKTGKEIKKVLKALELGQVDIVIGTHRLLSQDVKFADLGLVIIDEEQRFGVEHKQILLQLRMMVDVLTLSATPIPRTLHMSMLGLRDISSLSTAPLDRRAIVTEVIAYDEKRIKQAIVRELNRQGQVFFVHNRVHNIQSVADDIQKLVPEARIIIGHGQMGGHDLEKVMLKFIRGDADILVCTTIIESGIDIPTANTMFINRADHFGLAELHQLRGRVGRYKHRAYCYLLLPEDRPLTESGAKRLQAIEQYSMLGAGFKIAMRDLEIRGAGNLLGAEQSGHIAAVGYELYCQLLDHETKRLQTPNYVEPARTHLELPIKGGLTKRYISSDKYRMEAYRRISRADSLQELDLVVKDLTDAYGEMPAPADELIQLAEVRLAAGLLGVESIKLEGPDLIFRCRTPSKLDATFRGAPGRTSVVDDHHVYFRPPPAYLEPKTLLPVLRKLLVRPLRETMASEAGTHGQQR